MKTAVAYTRYSSDNQREESIEAQLYDIKKYAQSEGIAIMDYYSDEATSGLSTNRPGFKQMIEDVITKGGIDYIIVHKVDRFSRDKYQSAIYKEKLSRRGVKVLYAAQKLADTPEGGLMESILEGFSQYYSDNLSQETRKGLYTNARKALYNGGVIPFGFAIDEDKHYILAPREAAGVRLIFELFLKVYSQREIAAVMNEHGYKTRYNRPFTVYSVTYILSNPKYMGVYEYGRLEHRYSENGKRTVAIERPSSEIVRLEDALPAIITKAQFLEVQEMIRTRRNARSPRQKIDYPLKGLIFTADGHTMSGATSKGRGYYRSKKTGVYIRREPLENYIITVARDYILQNSDALLEKLEAEVGKLLTDKDADRKILKKRLDEIDQEESNCIDFITQMGANQKVKEKLDELAKEKEKITQALSIELDPVDIKKELRTWIEKIRGEEADTVISKKDLIKLMVRRVEVGEKEVKIYFNFPPNSCTPRAHAPACAGNTTINLPDGFAGWDHPRVCGEYWKSKTRTSYRPGSPPRVRGIRSGHG